MANIFEKGLNKVTDTYDEVVNEKTLKSKSIIVTEMRLCTSAKDNTYFKAHINKELKKMYFLSKRPVECGSILCDELGNVYQIVDSSYEVNELLDNGKITTISEYEKYTFQNPFRQKINQIASVKQTISGITIHNEGELHLSFEQQSVIEQNITVQELIESADEEIKYRFKPIKSAKEVLGLISDVANCVKSIADLKSSLVSNVVKQASGILKTILEMLIKKVEKEALAKSSTKDN